MKNPVLLLFFIFLPSMVLAQNGAYLKGGIGFNHINSTEFTTRDFEGKVKLSDSFPLIEVGIGYKFDNLIRVETVIDYYFLFRTLETSTNLENDIFKISAKTKANNLMFNIYKDILSIGKLTPFVGGGIGITFLKESATGHVLLLEDNLYYPLNPIKSKKRKQFAYKLTLGTDIKFSDTIIGEVCYNYFNLGNNKKKIISGVYNIGRRTYEIHNITIGMRFKI
jgi:opacity protein-like surface antigen